MNLIICLDADGGYSFANRRQSRDRILLDEMLQIIGDNRLFVNGYTAKLFESVSVNLVVCDNPLKECADSDFCFAENIGVENISPNKIIICRWNRSYPYDKKFPENLLINKQLVSSFEFKGNSHEKITVEVFE